MTARASEITASIGYRELDTGIIVRCERTSGSRPDRTGYLSSVYPRAIPSLPCSSSAGSSKPYRISKPWKLRLDRYVPMRRQHRPK